MTIKDLKAKNNEERNIRDSYVMKLKFMQDKYEKSELKAKTLGEINENLKKQLQELYGEEDQHEELQLNRSQNNKNTSKNIINAMNNDIKTNIKINYFSKSLHK